MDYKIENHKLGDVKFKLGVADEVFKPTSTTRFLVLSAEISPECKVLDLGCGAGPVAIYAAKKRAGEVYAVDVMPEACELTEYNTKINNVSDKVKVFQGDLFDSLGETKFDIILDDVSGMADAVSRISGWYPEPIPTGGYDGTRTTLKMLDHVREHLTKDGELYFPVLTLANSKKIIDHAKSLFGDRLETIVNRMIPFCDVLKARITEMEKWKEEGLVDYIQRGSRYLWNLKVFRFRNV